MSAVPFGNNYARATVDVSRSVATISHAEASVVVPQGESWQILSAVANIATSAEAGNRTHSLQILDGDSVVDSTVVGANLAASQTTTRNFTKNVTSASGANVPLRAEGLFAAGGNIVRVFDVADIDAEDDEISVKIQVLKFYGG